VAYRNSYSAFGEPTLGNPSDASYTYAGAQFDSATGLLYMRDRYYDPTIGRFISEDPQSDYLYVLPTANWTQTGQGLNLRTPLALNRYTYASSDPIDYVDPNGAAPLPIGVRVCVYLLCAAKALSGFAADGSSMAPWADLCDDLTTMVTTYEDDMERPKLVWQQQAEQKLIDEYSVTPTDDPLMNGVNLSRDLLESEEVAEE
jgi:RHS repeat-associated protein